MDKVRDKIADIITNELFERFGSPSSAVIGVKLADAIVALPEVQDGVGDGSPRGEAAKSPA